MHLGLASLESIAMSIGAHVKELDLGGQANGGKTPKKSWDFKDDQSQLPTSPRKWRLI